VAYNSQNDKYLVVWQHNDGFYDRIYGRLIDGNGLPLLTEFQISNANLYDVYGQLLPASGGIVLLFPIELARMKNWILPLARGSGGRSGATEFTFRFF
jgi:hypothetical protein